MTEISKHLKDRIIGFSEEDKIILNNRAININKENFQQIHLSKENKSIAFVDGGQAVVISAGNFCVSFIRVAALIFKEGKKENVKYEFYLLTTAKYHEDDIFYESKIFGDRLIHENDLFISSNDSSIRTGNESAPLSQVTNMARRFAELALASQVKADYIILDGTLEKTFINEEEYLKKLPENISAVAKSSSLFTTSGNSPVILLNRMGPSGCWSYFVDGNTSFVKLHEKAKHVFRFEGNKEILPQLIQNSCDALFLGYPYGLIAVDRLARVSETERKSLKMNFLLREENKEIAEYLNTANAHDILDSLG